MCNSIFLGDNTLPDAKDGEKIKISVEGVYHTDPDGVRKLDVLSADGDEVNDPEDCGCGSDHSENDMPDHMNHDAEDALRIFILKKKK